MKIKLYIQYEEKQIRAEVSQEPEKNDLVRVGKKFYLVTDIIRTKDGNEFVVVSQSNPSELPCS